MIQDIGLVIWGCKGGCRTFCNNRVINVEEPVIRQTLKDVRSSIYFKRSGLDYYAVEFTQRYKVYTHYRSSNDSGGGAFIAITIYVPHNLMIKNVRSILDEMIVLYFKEYMNPMSYTPLPGKYDDINMFLRILDEHQNDIVTDRRGYAYHPSEQDDRPQIIKYNDVTEIDKYFENPYHKEFFACQEVMFLRSEYYDRPQEFDIDFVQRLQLIDKVSESVRMNRLLPFDKPGKKLSRLIINGDDFTNDKDGASLDKKDLVSFTIESADDRYEPMKADNITVEDMLRRRLIRKKGDDYEWDDIILDKRTYELKVSASPESSVRMRDFAAHLQLVIGKGKYHATVMADGTARFLLRGPEVDQECTLVFGYDEKTDLPIQKVVPAQHLDNGLTVAADEHQLKVKLEGFDGDSPLVEAEVKLAGDTVYTPIEDNKIYTPVINGEHATVGIRARDCNVKFNGDAWVVTPTVVRVKVFIPKEISGLLKRIGAKVSFNGKTYGINDSGKVSLPYGWEENGEMPEIQLTDESGVVRQPMNYEGGYLRFTGCVISNKTREAVKLSINGEEKTFKARTEFFHYNVDGKYNIDFANPLDKDLMKISSSQKDGFTYYVVEPKDRDIVVIPGGDSHSGNSKSKDKNDSKADKKLPFGGKGRILFHACKGYFTFEGEDRIKFDKTIEITVKQQVYKIFDPGNREVGSINVSNPCDYTTGQFDVKYKEENGLKIWEVTYRKTFIDKFIDFVTSKLGLGLIGLLVVLVIGGWIAWPHLFGAKEYTATITFTTDDPIASITVVKPENGITITPSESTITIRRSKDDKNQFAGTALLKFSYKDEGDTEKMLKDLPDVDMKSLRAVLSENHEKDASTAFTAAAPQSPAHVEYLDITSVTPLDSAKVANFQTQYQGSNYEKKLTESYGKQVAAEEEEKAKRNAEEASHQSLVDKYNKLLEKLNSMDVMASDVAVIEAFETVHRKDLAREIAANRAKVKAYKGFFKLDDSPSKTSYLQQFTHEQQEACKYYIKYYNKNNKNDTIRDFSYAKKRAKAMGIL
ncbi:MAG: hypothetical protein NC098_04735 [Lachnoclostridium sp.]|nr:hypothetical protein [Lachnoclostridium sp.]